MKDDERTRLERCPISASCFESNLKSCLESTHFCEGESRVHIRDENNVLVALMARVSNRAK